MRNAKKTSKIMISWTKSSCLRTIAGCAIAGFLLFSLVGCASCGTPCGAKGKSAEFLFVQTAHNVTFSNNTMTLHDVSPTTLFFADRPDRITGHQDTEVFVENWFKGSNSFAKNPPNAALSILGDDDVEIAEVVVELRNPKLANNNLSYAITILDGKAPSSGGASALFIDAIIITDPIYAPVYAPLYGPASYRGQARRVARRTARRVSRRR